MNHNHSAVAKLAEFGQIQRQAWRCLLLALVLGPLMALSLSMQAYVTWTSARRLAASIPGTQRFLAAQPNATAHCTDFITAEIVRSAEHRKRVFAIARGRCCAAARATFLSWMGGARGVEDLFLMASASSACTVARRGRPIGPTLRN
jgi:hypothetical protein